MLCLAEEWLGLGSASAPSAAENEEPVYMVLNTIYYYITLSSLSLSIYIYIHICIHTHYITHVYHIMSHYITILHYIRRRVVWSRLSRNRRTVTAAAATATYFQATREPR